MTSENILAMVLAGGQGSRLRPLTDNHAKLAISFGGCYRLVDFVLSKLVNSGIDSIYLLAQYKPESLIWYIQDNWDLASAGRNGFVWVRKIWSLKIDASNNKRFLSGVIAPVCVAA
jgi:glucose-1-phosphate adenylyltransferase